MPVIIKVHFPPFFSKNGPMAAPYLLTNNASKKNLRPLATIQVKIKNRMLKWINPLVMVNSLNGRGVNPAVNKIPSQDNKPPLVENFSFNTYTFS